jgi:hypothetical protein
VRNRHGNRGYALLEIVLVAAVLLPVLATILSMTSAVSDATRVNERGAMTAEEMRLCSMRVAKLLRPASLENLRVKTDTAWVPLVEDTDYDHVRFQSVRRLPSSSNPNLGVERAVRFELDPEELANGNDDDGDGLVDEGSIYVSDDALVRGCIATGVERFKLRKTGRLLVVTVTVGNRDQKGTVHRATSRETVYLRNN